MRTTTPKGELAIFGPARLVCERTPVRLRTKGLALLYVLALEGPVLRERVVDLLWHHPDAQNNLRVELHRLRGALRRCGLDAFPSGQDPLELPEGIGLDLTHRSDDPEPLLGLDDLSSNFQAWLDIHRSTFLSEQEVLQAPVRQEQVEDVARRVRPPFVIVTRGPPGAGRRTFVQAVAKRLGMPVVQDPMTPGDVVHVVDLAKVEPKKVAEHVARQRTGVWALMLSSFGHDGELLLRLRTLLPAEHIRFLEFDAVTWSDARSLLLGRLRFDEAARLYVGAGGNLDYLRDLVRLRPSRGYGPDLPLPQRIRAAYLLEANLLTDSAHAALELLALHPGSLSPAVVERLGMDDHLDVLEEAGWLRFDTAWTFTHEAARRVTEATVLPGRRAHDHRRLADAFAAVEPDAAIAVAYHRAAAGSDVPETPPSALSTWAQAWLDPGVPNRSPRLDPAATPVGHVHAILLGRHHGLQACAEPGWSHWVRRSQDCGPSLAEFSLPDERCVVRVEFRAYTESAFGVGFSGDAFPLRLWFRGGPVPERRVIFVADAADALLDDGTTLLSYHAARDVAFLCHHRLLRVESQAESGVVEFRLSSRALARSSTESMAAYDLVGQAAEMPRRR